MTPPPTHSIAQSVVRGESPIADGTLAASARHAFKIYGAGETAVTALDDLSLDLPSAQFTAIMGPSGSGKSTLMHCLAGLDTLTAGEVFIGGINLAALSDRERTTLRRDRLTGPPWRPRGDGRRATTARPPPRPR